MIVLLFGASRLPKLGAELGRAIASLRRALGGAKEMEASVTGADDDGPPSRDGKQQAR